MNKNWKTNCFSSRLLTTSIAMTMATGMFAQSSVVTGTVKDETGEPVIGAAVKVKGTGTGAVTDLNGNFSLKANKGQTLQISYVGMSSKDAVVSGKPLSIVLKDAGNLDDVYVVGYGIQKKSVSTAAIAKVNNEDLISTAPVRMDNALKGLVSGVQVTSSSGQPGAAARIRVRGVGTINDSDPIYIVDGIKIEGGIDFLNPSDIESMEVLKDASSCAIYGAEGGNGVILVTTRKGTKGKTRVTYDFSYGISNPAHMRDVLNASEYALMMNEGRLNAGMSPLYNDPYSYGEGTDWQKEVFNKNAADQRHQISISGASDKINYYLSAGYNKQEGIVGGNYGRSNYDRLTLRSNTNYALWDNSKERNWLQKAVVTVNMSYAKVKSTSITENSTWGSSLSSALALSPILTVYDTDPAAQLEKYSGSSTYTPMYSKDGQLYTVPGTDYAEMNNPIAELSLPASQNWSHKFVASAALDLDIWDGLHFRSQYSTDLSFWGYDSQSIKYYLSGNNHSEYTGASSQSSRGNVWNFENVLSYEKQLGKHFFKIMVGQSARNNKSYYVGGSAKNLVDESKPSISYSYGAETPVEISTETVVDPVSGNEYQVYKGYNLYTSVWGKQNSITRLASYFGRVNYNYDERYMAEFDLRRDGSSLFGSNKKWGTFPSFSLGWNVWNEPYLQDVRPSWFNNMKVRYSWGKNGNDNISQFLYTALTSSGNNYLFGTSESVATGVKASVLANPDLMWEQTAQHDIGIDFGFFNNAFTFTVDYYNKRTQGMLMQMMVANYVGESAPWGNSGKMENSGVEMEATYKHKWGDWNFRVSGNMTYLRNRLLEMGNENGWTNYDSFQGTGTISRGEEGYEFPFFYGYKTNGIFQNMDEVNAYTNANGELIQPNAVPGDVRFVDVNGDGTITDEDRTKIGKGTPDWSWGFNVALSWKNWDFSMMWQGTIGNDIYDCTRRTDITRSNLPAYMLNRWTGEGTSNKYPRYVWGDNTNWQSSDLYVYDGTYCRLKNIQIGYTLPQRLTKKAFVQRLRVFASAENLLTFTKYPGYDPEISSGGTSLGVDYGVYPQPRTFTFGLNLEF